MDTIIEEKLESDFYESAVKHGEEILTGGRNANKLHKRLTKIHKTALSNGYENMFAKYINNSNESVALWAAVFLLKTNEELAVSRIKELTLSKSIFAMEAKIILDLREKGMIK